MDYLSPIGLPALMYLLWVQSLKGQGPGFLPQQFAPPGKHQILRIVDMPVLHGCHVETQQGDICNKLNPKKSLLKWLWNAFDVLQCNQSQYGCRIPPPHIYIINVSFLFKSLLSCQDIHLLTWSNCRKGLHSLPAHRENLKIKPLIYREPHISIALWT